MNGGAWASASASASARRDRIIWRARLRFETGAVGLGIDSPSARGYSGSRECLNFTRRLRQMPLCHCDFHRFSPSLIIVRLFTRRTLHIPNNATQHITSVTIADNQTGRSPGNFHTFSGFRATWQFKRVQSN